MQFFVNLRVNMGQEIERKFLVREPQKAFAQAFKSERIEQGYLSPRPEATVRLRIRGDRAWITVKSPNHGATRGEWEYPIPVEDAREMMPLCQGIIIDKTRHLIDYEGHTWEVDEFHSPHAGLVTAEVELKSADERVELPDWLGEEVTGDPRYYNSNLSKG